MEHKAFSLMKVSHVYELLRTSKNDTHKLLRMNIFLRFFDKLKITQLKLSEFTDWVR